METSTLFEPVGKEATGQAPNQRLRAYWTGEEGHTAEGKEVKRWTSQEPAPAESFSDPAEPAIFAYLQSAAKSVVSVPEHILDAPSTATLDRMRVFLSSAGHLDTRHFVTDYGRHLADVLPVPSAPLAERIIEASKDLIGLDLRTAPIDHQVLQVNLQYALGPYVVVDGEWCTWREDEILGVVVKREPWSLLGTGETLPDAISDFRKEATELATVMQHDSLAELTEEARRMQDFVVRYLPKDG